jgi:hypothetical protein
MQKKEETGTNAFPPLFVRFHFQNYADSLYEIGMVNTPLTEGLNFHSLANQWAAESPRRGDECEITVVSIGSASAEFQSGRKIRDKSNATTLVTGIVQRPSWFFSTS